MDHSVQQTPQHLFATSAISLYSTEKLQRPASRRRIIKNRQNWRRNFRSSQFLNGSFLRIETSQNRLPGQFYTILVVLQQIRSTSGFNAKFDAAPEPPRRLNASPQRLETTPIELGRSLPTSLGRHRHLQLRKKSYGPAGVAPS